MTLTINQALDKLMQNKKLNLEQQNLKFSLKNLKIEFGGNVNIDNVIEVENIIEFGNKEGIEEI
jgi:thiamine pyrophosphokinase